MKTEAEIADPVPNSIALMQKYRARLTVDLVTGKLDVREAAANPPELASVTALASAYDE